MGIEFAPQSQAAQSPPGLHLCHGFDNGSEAGIFSCQLIGGNGTFCQHSVRLWFGANAAKVELHAKAALRRCRPWQRGPEIQRATSMYYLLPRSHREVRRCQL